MYLPALITNFQPNEKVAGYMASRVGIILQNEGIDVSFVDLESVRQYYEPNTSWAERRVLNPEGNKNLLDWAICNFSGMPRTHTVFVFHDSPVNSLTPHGIITRPMLFQDAWHIDVECPAIYVQETRKEITRHGYNPEIPATEIDHFFERSDIDQSIESGLCTEETIHELAQHIRDYEWK